MYHENLYGGLDEKENPKILGSQRSTISTLELVPTRIQSLRDNWTFDNMIFSQLLLLAA